MKTRWIWVPAVLLIAAWSMAARADDASVQKELQANCDKLSQALKDKKADVIIAFYAPDYMGKRPDGTVVNREQLETQLRQQMAAIKAVKQAVLKVSGVKSTGDTEAAANAALDLTLTVTGEDGADHEIVSKSTSKQTWVKTDSGWKLRRTETLTQEQTVDGQKVGGVSQLLAGVARANITPPVGISMVGFAGRGPAVAVHDDLSATTLALEADGKRAFVIALDLIGVSDRFVAGVRAEIERRLEAAPAALLLCASHTHYGPTTGAYEDGDLPGDVATYMQNLLHQLAGTALAAVDRLEPARVGVSDGESRIGINRRERLADGRIILGQNPGGACDRQVRVVRLDTAEGRPLAALVNFACHPVSPHGRMREISADWVGVMRQLVEGATGATCLFLQGAAGNINPVEMRHSFEPARRLGTMLGGEVMQRFEETVTAEAAGLAAASARVELPGMEFASLEEGEREAGELQAQLDRLRAEGAAGGAIYWAESRLKRANQRLESLRTGVPLPTIGADLSALRFGDVALATSPGELFNETGAAVKARSPLPRTCFAAYTNGTIGYVPIPAAYPEGGYEVTHACRVGPEAAGMIEKKSLELLTEAAVG